MKKIIIPLVTGLTVTATTVIPLLASCASKKITVTLKDSPHVSIDVSEVDQNKDLKITFNAEQGYLLGYIESIFIGNKEYFFWDFFYYRYEDKTKGELYIPKEYVTENINVKVHAYQAVNVYDIEYDEQTKLGTLKGFTDAFKALPKEDQADLLGHEITIPANVSSIENGAFYGEINGEKGSLLPESVLVLNFEQFSNCKTIGVDAFREASFTSINLPVSLETINKTAFFNCKSLSEIEFPYGLMEIGESSFNGCTNLWKIELPATLSIISENAFYGCTSLKRILLDKVIDEWPEGFHTKAFNSAGADENCKFITKTHWSATAASLAWPNLANWTYQVDDEYAHLIFDIIENDGKKVLKGFTQDFLRLSTVEGGDLLQKMIVGHQYCITIPSWVDEIAENAFYKADNAGPTWPSWITKVDFDSEIRNVNESGVEIDGCTSIGKNAFYSCPTLENLYLINTIQTIGENAFGNCKKLTTIDVNEFGETKPDGWNAKAFQGSGDTKGKIIVESDSAEQTWKEYFSDAGFDFSEGKWETKVKDQIKIFKTTGDGVCSGFSVDFLAADPKLQKTIMLSNDTITIPENFKSIEASAFFDGKSSTFPTWANKIRFYDTEGYPSQLTTIGTNFLNGNSTIQEVILPKSLTTLGRSAFNGGVALEKIELPANMFTSNSSVGDNAFYNCKNLHVIDLSAAGEYIDIPSKWSTKNVFQNVGKNTTTIDGKTWNAGSGVIYVANGVTPIVQKDIIDYFKTASGSTMAFDASHWTIETKI